MLLARTVLWRPAVSLPVQLPEEISHERAGKTDKAATGHRRFDAGAMHAAPCLSELMGGENAPRSLQNLWRLHRFGKPRTLDLSASQAGKTVNSSAITTPGKTMPPNAVWELKLLMPYIRISTIGSVPTARKAVRAHKRNQQKTAGKSCASGRCTADPWRDRCSGPAVRFA